MIRCFLIALFIKQVYNLYMKNQLITIILRTKNEAEYLPQVFNRLKNQRNLINQVIVVDSGSSDDTIAIAEHYQAKIIRIPASDFSYSYSLNVGVEQADSELIGVFSGHSVPIFDDFLQAGVRYFKEPKVAGVYGPCLPLENARLAERFYYGLNNFKLHRQPEVIDQPKLGIMGNTNAIFSKKLWQEHKFDLKMAEGGEDAEWALYWLSKGYKFIFEPRLAVKHSHGLTLTEFYQQWQHWNKIYKQALDKYQLK